MKAICAFFVVLWLYRRSPLANAVRVAYGCAFRSLPF